MSDAADTVTRNGLLLAVVGVLGASNGFSKEAVLDLDSRCDTSQCVEELAESHCYARSALIEACKSFLQSLNLSGRRHERAYRMTYAAASGALASRIADEAERDRLRGVERDTYEQLVREKPNDAQALMGLVSIARDRNERIALLKRVVAADPTDTIALRTLAAHLQDGTASERTESLSYLRQAYDRAPAPHR